MRTRTFILTLLLCLLFLNGSIALFSAITLQQNLDSAKQRAVREFEFAANSISKDLQALSQRPGSLEEDLERNLISYSDLYRRQGLKLVVYKDSRALGYAEDEVRALSVVASNERTARIEKGAEQELLWVEGVLAEPYQRYGLGLASDLTGTIVAWSDTTRLLFVIGALMSSLLAAILLAVLSQIFRPLSRIAETAAAIGEGAYEQRLEIQTDAELADVAAAFNRMSEEIQQRMQELQEAVVEKQSLIDNMAHELRTPLTAIYGYAEYVQKATPEPERLYDATQFIMEESRRLQNLADSLLSMAALRRSSLISSLIHEEIDLASLLESVERSFRFTAAERGISLAIQRDERVQTLRGDGQLIYQLLVILVDNAVKACASGGTIQLQADCGSDGAIIRVCDDGCGMSSEHLQRITEPFYRIDASRSRSLGGTGLGLAIAAEIARAHEAILQFRSVPGSGTEVSVLFTSP